MENDGLIAIASSVKCGEILFLEKKFTFNCTNCDTNFDHYPTFTKHFLTCFQNIIEKNDETNSFIKNHSTSGAENQEQHQQQQQPLSLVSTFQIHSAKEQSQVDGLLRPATPETRTTFCYKKLKPPTDLLLNLVVNRCCRRWRHCGRRSLIKPGRKILYNCRACGKKYFTKVAFKAHKLTNNCIKDALHLAIVGAIEKNVRTEEEEDAEEAGLSLQLNPPIETSEKFSMNNHHHISNNKTHLNIKSKTFNCTNCEKTFIFEHLYQEHLIDNHCPMFDLDDGEPKGMVINDQMLSAVDALGDRQKDHIFESSENEIQTELDILSDGEIGIADLLDEEMTAFVDQIQNEPFPNDFDKTRTKKHKKDDNGCYSCSKCDKVYDNYKTFTSHIRGHERRYVCTYCGKGFPQSTHLKAHLFIHTGERPYKCDVCSATFNALGSLRGHKRIHSGERPYPCDYCEKSFLTSSARTIHHRQHTKEIRFVCNVCNKGYINKHLYVTHMNKHNNKRDFACEICDQKFFDKWTWKKHQVVHLNDRKFICDVCDAKFPRERTLREHKKLHSKIKEYKCTSCSKEFAQYAGLYSHMKRQHRID